MKILRKSDSPKTMRKLCLSAKFPHQEIRWNYVILRSGRYQQWSPIFIKVTGLDLHIYWKQASLQTNRVYSTLKRHGNNRFRVVSMWNTRGVFVGFTLSCLVSKNLVGKKWQNLSQVTKSCNEENICQRKFLTANFFTKRMFFASVLACSFLSDILNLYRSAIISPVNRKSVNYFEFIIWKIQFIQKK